MCEFGKFVGRSVEGKWKIIDRVLVVSVVVPDKCECDDGGWMVVQNSEQELFHFHETKTKRGKCVSHSPSRAALLKWGACLLACFSSPEKPCVVVLAPKKLWHFIRARVWMVGGPIFIVVR